MIDEKQTVKREDLLLQLKALAEEFQPQKGKPPKRMNDRDMERAGKIAAQLLAPEGDVKEVWALLKVLSHRVIGIAIAGAVRMQPERMAKVRSWLDELDGPEKKARAMISLIPELLSIDPVIDPAILRLVFNDAMKIKLQKLRPNLAAALLNPDVKFMRLLEGNIVPKEAGDLVTSLCALLEVPGVSQADTGSFLEDILRRAHDLKVEWTDPLFGRLNNLVRGLPADGKSRINEMLRERDQRLAERLFPSVPVETAPAASERAPERAPRQTPAAAPEVSSSAPPEAFSPSRQFEASKLSLEDRVRLLEDRLPTLDAISRVFQLFAGEESEQLKRDLSRALEEAITLGQDLARAQQEIETLKQTQEASQEQERLLTASLARAQREVESNKAELSRTKADLDEERSRLRDSEKTRSEQQEMINGLNSKIIEDHGEIEKYKGAVKMNADEKLKEFKARTGKEISHLIHDLLPRDAEVNRDQARTVLANLYEIIDGLRRHGIPLQEKGVQDHP